jgi:hypothetical protein
MPEQSDVHGFDFSMGEDGILRLRLARGTVIDLDLAKRIEAGANELSGGTPCPMLAHGDDTRNIDRAARRYLANIVGPTAQAVVVNSPIGRMIASVFIGLSRKNAYPMRMFATEEEAVEWLKTFLPGSSRGAPQGDTTAEV